ncbi:MAG: hypothetical protein IKC77_04470, partial [Lentisphaeria bacterium]|nr:hypothetical protein [Lentisphaeria bacterium]
MTQTNPTQTNPNQPKPNQPRKKTHRKQQRAKYPPKSTPLFLKVEGGRQVNQPNPTTQKNTPQTTACQIPSKKYSAFFESGGGQ